MYDFKVYEHGKATKGTVFAFGAWRVHRFLYYFPIKRLNRAGYKCILCTPSTRLLQVGATPLDIVAASVEATEFVKSYIFNDQQKNAKYIVLGASLGTLFATEVAKKCPEIKILVLFSPFSDIKEHMSFWINHRYFGKVARSWPTSPEISVKIFSQANPMANLNTLKGKTVVIGYGRNDTLMHTHIIEKFVNQLRISGISVQTKTVSGDHFISLCKLNLWFKPKKLLI